MNTRYMALKEKTGEKKKKKDNPVCKLCLQILGWTSIQSVFQSQVQPEGKLHGLWFCSQSTWLTLAYTRHHLHMNIKTGYSTVKNPFRKPLRTWKPCYGYNIWVKSTFGQKKKMFIFKNLVTFSQSQKRRILGVNHRLHHHRMQTVA